MYHETDSVHVLSRCCIERKELADLDVRQRKSSDLKVSDSRRA